MQKPMPLNSGVIEKKVLIEASPAIVYQALTEAKDLTRWFCDRASSEPRVGGELKAYWKTGRTGQKGRAVFTQMVPEVLVELLWVDDIQEANNDEARHLLTYQIQPKRSGSEVVVCDKDHPPPDDETFAILSEGWNSVLLELKDYCERKARSMKRRPGSYD
jgi:uncharacterized protein YndB with AHSA1/START domain